MITVSVITPLFKGERYLRCLSEMIFKNANNALPDYETEWIIINDDPDDFIENIPVVESVNVILVNQKTNMGIHGARIEGFKRSNGDYVLFLDQDDTISDNWILSQCESIGNADAVVCDCIEDGKSVYGTSFRPSLEESICYDYILTKRNGFIPGQVLIKRSSIPNLWTKRKLKSNYCDDYYLWLCMYAAGCSFTVNNNTNYNHVMNGNNQSYKMDAWLESTHELMHVIRDEKVFSNDDLERFIRGREGEIEETMERMSWDSLRASIYRWASLLPNNKKSINKIVDKKVAIYGLGIGEGVGCALKTCGINVICFIDRLADSKLSFLPICNKENIPEEVEMIVNTLLKEENKKEVYNYINSRLPHVELVDVMEIMCW